MNTLGNKKNHISTLGNKNYHLNYLGNKVFSKGSKSSNLQTTPNGIIENYSNHPHTMAEPIKGVENKQSKNNYQVEKPKKSKKHNDNYD